MRCPCGLGEPKWHRSVLSCAVALVLVTQAFRALAAPPVPVAKALSMIAEGRAALATGWRYQETITDSRGSRRLSYDPSQAKERRWRVLSINGKRPSRAAQKQFAALAAKNRGRAMDAGVNALGGWLQQSGFERLPDSGDRLVYQVRPRAAAAQSKADRALLKHLSGRLILSRSDHRPISLELENFESFSPRFGVTIDSFTIRATFTRLAKGGAVVMTAMHSSARGKIFWVKHFGTKTTVKLLDFSPIPGTAAAAAH